MLNDALRDARLDLPIQKMAKGKVFFALVWVFLCLWSVLGHHEGLLVKKEERRVVSVSESGSISAVDVRDWIGGTNYHLQFITMEPNSLFLPVLLHADMVFYVHSGKAKINYIEEDNNDSDSENKKKDEKKESSDGSKSIDVEVGDVYRLKQGTAFYIRSYSAPTRVKLRIHAIFNTASVEDPREQLFGAYSNISDLVRGFDERILQTGFAVSKELVQSIKWAERTPPIVPYVQRNESDKQSGADNASWKEGIIESMIGFQAQTEASNKKKSKARTFNFYSGKPDVKNCYGWSTAITHEELKDLGSIDIGAFMVNLTTGSMMGPHWNPKATEISVVTHGQGMVQVVCPTNAAGQFVKDVKCQNSLYRVKEGDVFVVPKYHPMTQIAFNNDSFVFMGFSTNARSNYPQFLAGQRSVLKEINSEILKAAFGAPNSTVVEELLSLQRDAVILGCTSCAEELMKKAGEQERRSAEEKRRKEEKRREEEARRREEEEARRREEEESRRREEEEARRKEERQKEEEEARRREEEEAREREEERTRREQQEEEARRSKEEQARRREEEQAQREEKAKREQEEEARRREEQARREEEEEEARRREQEEEEARRREEEEERRREERQARREKEEEKARRREEEEARRREEEEGEQWIRKNLRGWK